MQTTTDRPTAGRLRTAWRAANAPVAGVPRWAAVTAHLVPLLVLPSGIWRIVTVTFNVGGGAGKGSGEVPAWLPIELYVVLLSVLSELLAFSAVGLVARWGEVFPRWTPGLAGRRVPPALVIIVASAGAAILTVVWTVGAVAVGRGTTVQGDPLPADFPLRTDTWDGLLAIGAYAPLYAWGPALAVLTVHYARRRLNRAHRAAPRRARPDLPRA
ncbi:hypothetical protein AB0I28_07880 [Phytomonospora sp. NPDC050363]|uniref:hypothetical protein n=1 Tax=Phytomonospora sp. NPDC050363 TaxID=3155642 RepID=UPI0033EA9409